jgi:hypothetical protein
MLLGAAVAVVFAGPLASTAMSRLRIEERGSYHIGVGVGTRIETSLRGDPDGARDSRGWTVETRGMAVARQRLIGYAEVQARRGRHRWFVLPDLWNAFEFGGRVAVTDTRDVRRRGFAGISGRIGAWGGIVGPGRVSAYARGSGALRYHVAGSQEGAFFNLPFGLGGGLRAEPRPDVTVMIGPRVDAVIGAQVIGQPRLVAQIMGGGDFTVQARAGDAYVAVVADVAATVAGHRHGGQRVEARAAIDVARRLVRDLRITCFAQYGSLYVAGAPGHPQFVAEGQSLLGHTFFAGVGLGG